jgi:membrane-associated phospholipid phosphatase
VACVVVALLSAGSARAAGSEAPPTGGAYRLSVGLDVPLLLIAGGSAAGFLFLDETGPPACAPLCDKANVNAFDRPFAGNNSHAWQVTGDISTAATLLLVPAGLILGERNRYVFADLLVVGEAVLVTSAIQVPLSYAVERARPRLYSADTPLEDRTDANSGRSFFSGHVANCLAGTMVASTALRRLGHRTLGWTVLGVGIAGSAIVGIARVGAGGHFPSDVLIGYAVGAGVGIAIPAMHDAQLAISPMAGPQTGGVSVAGAF